MISKKKSLANSSLYLILDRGSLKKRDPIKIARKAASGGVDIIQLRDKLSCDKEIIRDGNRLKKIADSKTVLLIVNDRIDICKILDADGVHLGQDDISLKKARSILGGNKIIGISCHSLKEAIRAQKEGADYIAIGPVFRSPTKPELKPKGITFLKKVDNRTHIPIIAIGGITRFNAGKIVMQGADIIAVASAVLEKKDIKRAASDLKKEIIKAKRMK